MAINHIFRPADADFTTVEIDGKSAHILKTAAFENFTTEILGLGDVGLPSKGADAIAAVFDLEGFTKFCGQIEPQLSVPKFLSKFLTWLMDKLKERSIRSTHADGVWLYWPLPFFVKFLGDGVLVLWDATTSGDIGGRITMMNCSRICSAYKSEFHPLISRSVVDPPAALRCGLARGTVYSVGNGSDFVGSCINMAARLQKLPGLTFALNIRGVPVDTWEDEHYSKFYVTKRVSIRGIGENELVCLLKTEYDALSPPDRGTYRDV